MTQDWWVPSGLLSDDFMTRLMMKKKCMQHPGQFRDNQAWVYTLMRVFTGRLHQWVGWKQSSESGRVVIILLMFFANRYLVWALLTGWRVYWRITIDMRIQHGADVCFLLSNEGLSHPEWMFQHSLKGSSIARRTEDTVTRVIHHNESNAGAQEITWTPDNVKQPWLATTNPPVHCY